MAMSLYPIVIRQSRYSGIYEGGMWYAIANHDETNLQPDYLSYIDGDDDEAMDFWYSDCAKHIGVGNSPDEALANLLSIYQQPEPKTYKEFRDRFDEHVESRKQNFTQRLSDIMNIHIERTGYFEQSSGFKANDINTFREES